MSEFIGLILAFLAAFASFAWVFVLPTLGLLWLFGWLA